MVLYVSIDACTDNCGRRKDCPFVSNLAHLDLIRSAAHSILTNCNKLSQCSYELTGPFRPFIISMIVIANVNGQFRFILYAGNC